MQHLSMKNTRMATVRTGLTLERKRPRSWWVGFTLLAVCVLGANFGCGPSSESRDGGQSQSSNSVAVSPPASGDQDNTNANPESDSESSNSGKGNSSDTPEPEPEPEPEPKQPDSDPPKPEPADREQMTADYRLDPVGAHRRYRDKTFEVEGYVYLIFTEGPHPHPAVSLVDEPTNPTNPALVRLRDAALIEVLQGIQRESIGVVLSAKCSGFSDNMLQFKEGELVLPTAESVARAIRKVLAQGDAESALKAADWLARYRRAGVFEGTPIVADELADEVAALKAKTGAEKPNEPKPPEFTVVELSKLVGDYDASPYKADDLYLNKRLQLTGKVGEIDRKLKKYQFFTLTDDSGNRVRVGLDDSKYSGVPQVVDDALAEGRTLTIQGTCTGQASYQGVVGLKDCVLVSE